MTDAILRAIRTRALTLARSRTESEVVACLLLEGLDVPFAQVVEWCMEADLEPLWLAA